jgi:hypothetical protein
MNPTRFTRKTLVNLSLIVGFGQQNDIHTPDISGILDIPALELPGGEQIALDLKKCHEILALLSFWNFYS